MSEQHINHLINLIIKSQLKQLDADERADLESWISSSAENKQLYEELTDEENFTNSLTEFNLSDKRIRQKLNDKILAPKEEGIATEIRGNTRRSKIFRIGAWVTAAATVFFAVAGIYWYQTIHQRISIARQATNNPKTDALPGGNKAILTLAGGTTVILQNSQHGILSKQAGSDVEKTKDGELTYKTLDEKPNEIAYNKLTTPRGGQFQLVLPDGTRVWLNAASSIKYPTAFIGSDRVVDVTGEVYFEVAKNKNLPFKVNLVNGTQVEVLGTHFNINSYDDEPSVSTTLLEGSVKIHTSPNTTTDREMLLKPGQQAQTPVLDQQNTPAAEIKIINEIDIDDVMAWKNGAFHFEKANIYTVMRQLSRWYDVDVVFEGKNQTEHLFGGDIGRNLKLSEVLENLGKNNIHTKISGNVVTVTQ